MGSCRGGPDWLLPQPYPAGREAPDLRLLSLLLTPSLSLPAIRPEPTDAAAAAGAAAVLRVEDRAVQQRDDEGACKVL